MKQTAKKVSTILLAASMMGSLAACAGGKDNNGGSSPSASPGSSGTASGSASAAPQEDLSPLTLSLYGADPNPNWNNFQDEVSKVIAEKTGVTLNAEWAVGDGAQKVSLIAASGEYPDLIIPKGDMGKMVDAGAMIDLTELIEEHAPNIKKLYGDYMKRLRYSETDPAIYFLPTYGGVDQTTFDAGGGFELQHAVVKELGYPTIRTVKDFESAIKTYKDKHPEIDGKPTIGLSLNADDWRMYISVTNPAFLSTGAPDDGEFYIDLDTHEAMYHFRRPEEKEYFRWLNHMNDIGLLDKESFVQKYDQYLAKVASGRVLGLIDQKWDYQDGENALKSEGKFDRGYGHYPVTLTEEYKDASFQPTGYMAGWGIGITTNAKDPVRASRFLDFLASEEGQILLNWGIEGKHYNVENGKRVIPAELQDKKINDAATFAKETGIGLCVNFTPRYGDGVKDSTGNYFTTNFPDQVVAGYNDVEKETLAAYKATTWKDLFPKEDEFRVKPWGAAWNIPVAGDSDLAVLMNKMRDITWKRVPEAILAKPDQFDGIWDAYMQEIDKAGVKDMEQQYTELVKARVKMWNE